MKKKHPIEYDYVVQNISEGNDIGYKATILAFNSLVFGKDLQELEEGIAFAIEEEIRDRKKKKQFIPPPNTRSKYSGKFMIRLQPYLHEQIAIKAKAEGKSLNTYIQEKILF